MSDQEAFLTAEALSEKVKAYRFRTLRVNSLSPFVEAERRFARWLANGLTIIDACFLDAQHTHVGAVISAGPRRPVLAVLRNTPWLASKLREWEDEFKDWALLVRENQVAVVRRDGLETPLPVEYTAGIGELVRESLKWAGSLEANGDHVFDPRTPSPGPHFRVNLLIGDRVGFPNALLTTPKAVVDEWGRGSSRAHSDRQILATRWDLLPEENGFPANRQFYLAEAGQQIFYSASPPSDCSVLTRHATNHTVITYELADGLLIERTIFCVPSEKGIPAALEAQLIRLTNRSFATRTVDLVLTGMFGFIYPGALSVDVLYTCITVEPGVVSAVGNGQNSFIVAPRYTAGWGVEDRPFHVSQIVQPDGRIEYPCEFCLSYRAFVGNGTLEKPANLMALDNRFPPRGPGFFAVKLRAHLVPDGTAEIQSVTGLVSHHEVGPVTDERLIGSITPLVQRMSDPAWLPRTLQRAVETQRSYQSAVQIHTPDPNINRLVNIHLPFQIRYQTYTSRSFCWTQKAFRQIGFREIQDLLAAIPFEVGAGRSDHVRALIGVWASHVYEFGYADHQFYWKGVEPGRYSDDALWLFQAVKQYVDVTGDHTILADEWPVAGTERRRPLFETLKAVLNYSGRISLGRHGLPLIDHADWNDTLNLDGEGLHGPEKEKLYRQQIEQGIIRPGDPIRTDLSESVMNGFLVEIARQAMVDFASQLGDVDTAREWEAFGEEWRRRLQAAWHGDFFARGYINRPNAYGITYFGAQGDGVSADPKIPGAYFLNSFTWSILSNVASEEQIRTMLARVEDHLVTPFGIRLCAPTRFDKLMGRTGSGDYAWGDRENGGVFKHAAMMACVAMFKAARWVKDHELAARLVRRAFETLQVVAPYRTLQDPYVLVGNPRFCTQYVNPSTGEHMGPLLTGTAPWMWLAYLQMVGVGFSGGFVEIDPVLPEEWEQARVEVQCAAGRYEIYIRKRSGFARVQDGTWKLAVNGQPWDSLRLPRTEPSRTARVEMELR